MNIIEINAQSNGAHRNAESSYCPPGWAEIPDGVYIPDSFPFVDVVLSDGKVTELIPGQVPEISQYTPDPDPVEARLAAMEEAIDFILMGGDL